MKCEPQADNEPPGVSQPASRLFLTGVNINKTDPVGMIIERFAKIFPITLKIYKLQMYAVAPRAGAWVETFKGKLVR